MQGTAVDRGVDTVLCHGTADGSVPEVDDGAGGRRQVFVPIDAIPLVQFEVAPLLAPGAVDGTVSGGVPAGEQGGWQRRGPNYLRYTVTKVELRLVRLHGAVPPPGTAPVTEGPRPYTWRHDAQQAGSDGLPVDLALLDWKPTNADKAVLEGDALDGTVEGRWDHVCVAVAEPARVLWTFRAAPLGPDDDGWRLDGEAWPDDPGTVRSQPVDTTLRVRETWRTGTFLDGLLPYKPAQVVGAIRPCLGAGRRPAARPGPLGAAPAQPSIVDSAALRQPRAPGPLDADDLGGARFPAPVVFGTMTPSRAASFCLAKVLEAPFEVSLTADAPAGLPEGLEGGPLHEVLRALDEQRRTELRDVVRISGGPHRELTLLIVARSKMVDKDLFGVRAFDSTGEEITGVTATFTPVSTLADLPPRWVTAGPWIDDVALALSYFGAFGQIRDMDEFLVKISLPAAALHVDVGIRPLDEGLHDFGLRPPSWYLAVIEGLSEREVRRSQDDGGEGADDADGLDNVLHDPGHALLLPDAEYLVIVEYTGEVGSKPLDPEDGQDPDEIVALRTVTGSEQRTFFTDAEAPRSLDPWMLAQFPAPDEHHHFHGGSRGRGLRHRRRARAVRGLRPHAARRRQGGLVPRLRRHRPRSRSPTCTSPNGSAPSASWCSRRGRRRFGACSAIGRVATSTPTPTGTAGPCSRSCSTR